MNSSEFSIIHEYQTIELDLSSRARREPKNCRSPFLFSFPVSHRKNCKSNAPVHPAAALEVTENPVFWIVYGSGCVLNLLTPGVIPRRHSSNGLFFPPPNLRKSLNPSNLRRSDVPSAYTSVAAICRSLEKASKSFLARTRSSVPRTPLSLLGAPTIWAASGSESSCVVNETCVTGDRGVLVLPFTSNVPTLTPTRRLSPWTISSTLMSHSIFGSSRLV